MGRKRREQQPSTDLPPLCGRIDWLLRHLWRNSISAMASDLGASHAALSRVLAGQMPSARMLEALANRPDIDVRWLLTGQGQPRPEAAPAGAASWPAVPQSLPVVTQPLPGDPRQFPELLTPLMLPAASPFLLESAYWLQVAAGAPIAGDPGSRVTAGDYLLVESAARWTRRPEAYLGRILALRLPDPERVILAQSKRDQEEFEVVRQHRLNTFGVLGEARLFPLLARSEARRKQPESTTGGEGLVRLYSDDVVGVVVQVVNFLGHTE